MIRQKILAFLYDQVQKNNLPHIRKNMVEDFEKVILDIISERELQLSADRMERQQKAASSEEEKKNA